MNRPQLVMDLFDGKKFLSIIPIKEDGSFGEEQEILFRESDMQSEDYCAVILGKAQANVKKTKSIALDLDIIHGLSDLLYLLSAFTNPYREAIFCVKKSRYGIAEMQFELRWDDTGKKKYIAEIE